ncbi:hypothetical protein [Pilimelia terevasa]|nr:hypothetical protein [Pilimelia terevasa]
MNTPTNPEHHQPKSRSHRRRHPRFPVTVLQPATVALDRLTPQQKQRRRQANQIGHALTPHHSNRTTTAEFGLVPDPDLHLPPQMAEQIAAQAQTLTADPPPGAMLIGRTLRGAVAVVVLHAHSWSLAAHAGDQSALLVDAHGAFGTFHPDSAYTAIAATVVAAAGRGRP